VTALAPRLTPQALIPAAAALGVAVAKSFGRVTTAAESLPSQARAIRENWSSRATGFQPPLQAAWSSARLKAPTLAGDGSAGSTTRISLGSGQLATRRLLANTPTRSRPLGCGTRKIASSRSSGSDTTPPENEPAPKYMSSENRAPGARPSKALRG